MSGSIIVSPLERIGEMTALHGCRQMVSLMAAGHDFARPGMIDRHLMLRMNDIAFAGAGDLVAPERAHVDQIIDFARQWAGDGPLLVHCWLGVSRSPAAAMIAALAVAPGIDDDRAIALQKSPTGGIHLERPHVGLGVKRLSMQIAELHPIRVDQGQAPNACSSEQVGYGTSQRPDADHRDMGLAQALLAGLANTGYALLAVIPLVVTMVGTALTAHPLGLAVQITFMFPDRQPPLDLIDHIPAGGKSGVPVSRAHTDPHRGVANLQIPRPVNTGHRIDGVALSGLLENALSLGDGQRWIGAVVQLLDRPPVMVIAHTATKLDKTATVRV